MKHRGKAQKNDLIVIGMVLGIGFILMGCAQRAMLTQNPQTVLKYSYIPLETVELANYKALVAIRPSDPQAPRAFFWIAQDQYNRKAWNEAAKLFALVANRYPASSWGQVAGVMAARALVAQKRMEEAVAWVDTRLQRPETNETLRKELFAVAEKIVNEALELETLQRLQVRYPDGWLGELILFTIGKRQLDLGMPDPAKVSFRQLLERFPESAFAPQAKIFVEQEYPMLMIDRFRVGALLPLSGPFAAYGKMIRQGLDLAVAQMNEKGLTQQPLQLVIEDTQNDPELALAGYKKMAETDRVVAVIGPVLSESVKRIADVTKQYQLPIITTSASDADITGLSPYIYRYMLTNPMQAEAMAEYMVLNRNFRSIGMLFSNNKYDTALADAFREKVKQLGGQVVAEARYLQGTTDFKEQMVLLGGVNPGVMKDLALEERKSMETAMQKAALKFAKVIAPGAAEPTEEEAGGAKEQPIYEKRVAIIRFSEMGKLAVEDDLGRKFTEKFSFALAACPGFKVLTQAQTLKGLQNIGLSPEKFSENDAAKIKEQLGIDELILGEIKQMDDPDNEKPEVSAAVENFPTEPSRLTPQPVRFRITLKCLRAGSGALASMESAEWKKFLPPDSNLKSLEAIYMPISDNDAVLAASQLAFYDVKVPIFGPDAWINPRILRQGGEALEGAIFTTGFWPNDTRGMIQRFNEQFEKTFSEPASLFSVQAYDALWLIGSVLRRLSDSPSARQEFSKMLASVKRFNGVTGTAEVKPNGEIARSPRFVVIHNNQFEGVD
jgi:ABC-type branched-subunit amino acid transport system substrate-binding protein